MSATADVALARDWAAKLEKAEAKRLGVKRPEARKALARKLQTAPGTLENIGRLRTKLLPSWLKERIRAEFVRMLQMEIQRLEHEIHLARQSGLDARDDALCAAEAQLAKAQEILNGA